jgi:hypothetical protein
MSFSNFPFKGIWPRETREGWPLLTVETEVDENSKGTNERGTFMVGSLGLSCRYKKFLLRLGCTSRPSTKYFFPHYTHFNSFVPLVQQAGMQPCWVACNSVYISDLANIIGCTSRPSTKYFFPHYTCADQPCIFSWPMVISNSVNEFL